MLFYKVEGIVNDADGEAKQTLRTNRERAHTIAVKSEAFHQNNRVHGFYFISEISDMIVRLGVITESLEGMSETLCKYLDRVSLSPEQMVTSEITFGRMRNLLSKASQNDFIEDDDEVISSFNLGRLLIRRGIKFGENLMEPCDRKELFSLAKMCMMHDTLLPELKRIYAGKPPERVYGHPVHYLIQTDDAATRRETAKILLRALYDNRRLRSKRYCYLDFHPGEDFPRESYDALYRSCTGGAVVVRYFAEDNSEEDGHALCDLDIIDGLCKAAKQYRNQLLTILCLPGSCAKAKGQFYENLGTVSMIEVREDLVSGNRAIGFLKALAKETGIRTNSYLLSQVEEGKSYLASELHEMYDNWYNRALRATVFPQYQNAAVQGKEAVKAAPKGSAYDELQEMIGLSEAKKIIRKALNYYKMQKLYEGKGMKPDKPAMHMVFTGNPGTAKTTAARLFARIMKDNGLLTGGQLIEVGRGDLVGKYVGWTAQAVQAKFQAAIGGVLFIDEAYSLVDDRSGSFGDEAINTIVQEMENHREEVVVIFAGYPDKMEAFLQKNPGLRSRIAFHVPFEDYDPQELCQIARLMGAHKGIHFTEDALKRLETLFADAVRQGDFGNGRFVRNVLEQAKMEQANRLLDGDFDSITAEDVATIQAEDIAFPKQPHPQLRQIGFLAS